MHDATTHTIPKVDGCKRDKGSVRISETVLFTPLDGDNLYSQGTEKIRKPLAAIVVDTDPATGTVNLTVFDHWGRTHARTEVMPSCWAFRE